MSIGIYVHVPFCLTRCGYCDFNTYADLDDLKPRYVEALVEEAAIVAPSWNGDTVRSVFFGGGTPTTLRTSDLVRVLERLRGLFAISTDAEVTVEANPDTVDREKLARLRRAGVDRISIGAQSFDRAVLASLERLHDPDAVRSAFEAARGAGYSNVNVDLIYGADGEGVASWHRTLLEATALEPEHISAYALTVEPSTPLGRRVASGRVPPPDPDLQADMFSTACDVLSDAGYGHYEVSNWARPGRECRHNLGYWERRPYLGLGAGAHSFRDDRRWWNIRPPEQYMRRVEAGEPAMGGEERLEAPDVYLEEVFLRLRTRRGLPRGWFDPERVRPLVEGGLLGLEGDAVVPTERGMALLNEVVLGLTS
jgi:oxygen-independent coproporphyrinogen-3 oxidase